MPTSARAFPGADEIVGYCANFLAIPSEMSEHMEVAAYLLQQRRAVVSALRFQAVPMEEMLARLNAGDDMPELPFAAVFNMDQAGSALNFSGLDVQVQTVPSRFALVDYRLDVLKIESGYRLDYDYRCNRFSQAQIERWHTRFEAIVLRLISGRDGTIGDLWAALAEVD